ERTIRIDQQPEPKRRGPLGPCSDEELVVHIRRVLVESPFHGEGYRKVWARLRFQGIRTSRERVRRLMRAHGLQAPQRVGHPHGPKAHDGTIITERPDEMWGTDMTTTATTEEGLVCVFVAVDYCTAEIVPPACPSNGALFPRRAAVSIERRGPAGPGAVVPGPPRFQPRRRPMPDTHDNRVLPRPHRPGGSG